MSVLLVCIATLAAAPVGCTKDTDCKGDRICEAGQCVSPPAPTPTPTPVTTPAPVTAPPTPPPAPPTPPPAPQLRNPADYPRVVRKNGVTCIQTLDDEGVVHEDCRTDSTSYSATHRPMDPTAGTVGMPSSSFPPPTPAEPEPPRSGVVADFGVLGTLGVLASSGVGVLPGLVGHIAVGGRLSESVGLGGVFNAQLGFGGNGVLVNLAMAPALRLGALGHANLALGPSLLLASTPFGSVMGLAGTLLIHGVVPIAGAFGIHFQFGIAFDASGAFLSFSTGFGGSVL